MTSMNPAANGLTRETGRHQARLIVASRLLSIVVLLVSVMIARIEASAQTTTSIPIANAEERRRGIDLYRQQQFADAAKILQKLVKKDRLDDEAWYYLGLALLHQPKQIKEASKAFETALKVRPNFTDARVALSYSLLMRNKLTDADREAQASLRIDPNIVDAHFVIGAVRLRTGAREDALAQAETTIKLNPQYPPGYLLKSQALASFFGDTLYLKEGEPTDARRARFSEAADALEKYLQLEPKSENKQTWTEQLESLRFYVASRGPNRGKDGPFSGSEVTTKVRVLAKPEPGYTDSARSAQITGTVVLRAIFASDGSVKHFLVVKGLPYGLTEAAVKAARKIKFVPATIDGRPVSMFIQLEYNFNLF